jgi:hypothetical protein
VQLATYEKQDTRDVDAVPAGKNGAAVFLGEYRRRSSIIPMHSNSLQYTLPFAALTRVLLRPYYEARNSSSRIWCKLSLMRERVCVTIWKQKLNNVYKADVLSVPVSSIRLSFSTLLRLVIVSL